MGVAVPDKVDERRLKILKEYGCNAIRCAHNQPTPEFLDMCDRMGFVVIDEAFDKWRSGYYEKHYDEWWKKDLVNMITGLFAQIATATDSHPSYEEKDLLDVNTGKNI